MRYVKLMLDNYFNCFSKYMYEKSQIICLLINLFIILYLLKENNEMKLLINRKFENKTEKDEIEIKKDMIGLKYPEIMFDEIKSNLIHEIT